MLTVAVGTALWGLAFLALLPFRDDLAADGRERWLWTCLAGFGLGLYGVYYVRRRRDAIGSQRGRRAEEEAAAPREPLT